MKKILAAMLISSMLILSCAADKASIREDSYFNVDAGEAQRETQKSYFMHFGYSKEIFVIKLSTGAYWPVLSESYSWGVNKIPKAKQNGFGFSLVFNKGESIFIKEDEYRVSTKVSAFPLAARFYFRRNIGLTEGKGPLILYGGAETSMKSMQTLYTANMETITTNVYTAMGGGVSAGVEYFLVDPYFAIYFENTFNLYYMYQGKLISGPEEATGAALEQLSTFNMLDLGVRVYVW